VVLRPLTRRGPIAERPSESDEHDQPLHLIGAEAF
jgi:hypothetical protein